MKQFIFFMSFVLSASASADDKPVVDVAVLTQAVHAKIVAPMTASRRKASTRINFSRSKVKGYGRVRMDDEPLLFDVFGKPFIHFAIVRPNPKEDDWVEINKGCIYLKTHDIFIIQNDIVYPHHVALGQRSQAAQEGTCRAQIKPKA